MDFSIVLGIITLWAAKICSSHPLSQNSSTSEILPGDFSYQCVIRIVADENINFLLCEGAIIDKKWILTAAGCVDKYISSPKKLDVVAGIVSTKNIESEPHAQVRKVSQINVSPLWVDSKKKIGDLALIELLKPFKLNEFVNKATFGKNAAVNEIARLVGYGKFDNLTAVELKIISNQECNLKANDDASELICAKKSNSPYPYYDESYAGAPLVNATNSKSSTDEVVGTMSAKSRYFTSIAHHKTWIENVAKIKSSNTASTTSAFPATKERSYSSDDGGTSDGSTSTTNGSSTTSTTPQNEDSTEEEDDEEEESSNQEKEKDEDTSTTDSTEDDSSESEETTTSSSSTEESHESTETSESNEEGTPTESLTASSEESSEKTEESEETTPTESSEESEESSDEYDDEPTETQKNTTTAPSPNTSQTSSPTSTATPSTTTKPATSTTSSTSTTSTSTSQPSTTSTSTPTTTSTKTTSPTTSTTDPDDYYDDDPDSHNRDRNSNDSFDKSNNKNSPADSAGSNAVTSNSAQPSNPVLISAMISKTNGFLNSIKKLTNFFAA